ncbi:MAG: anaerobic glycerol-3-phosphate dehydrogenase subunit C [Syntrophaceae bacterium]|nr:anaerobic glycerol-3-phosphate dehydrogenase subunit C [Syntrophaceae bacterium]
MAEGRIETIASDLKKIVQGNVLSDELSRTIYSSGACIYSLRPLVIVQPRHKEDVVECVRYAVRNGIPLTARGGGTGRAGQGIGEGIILDFMRYMNQVLEVDPEKKWVRVQPGVVLGRLNARLKPLKKFFPIDPSTADYCALGGMIANNSSGPHAIKYGATRDWVESLEVVLSSGEVIQTGPRTVSGLEISGGTDGLEKRVYSGILDLLARYQGPLREEKPDTMKNSCGYDLWQVRKNGSLDLTPLFVGSEGTLGVFTEAKLRLADLGGKTHTAFFYFNTLDTVGRATLELLKLSPTMLEIMEKQIIDLARAKFKEMAPYLPEGIEATLFVEFEGPSEEELGERMRRAQQRVVQEEKLAVSVKAAQNPKDREMLTKVRSVSGPILNKVKGPKKPIAFIEDAAVHPRRLGEYIAGLRGILKRNGAEASIYGHAGDGNLHVMVFLDMKKAEDVARMVRITEESCDLVLRLKGTISGEHGDGLLRTAYVPRQYPGLYPAFVELKKLFDPKNVLNPGRIVGNDPDLMGKHLKFGAEYHHVSTRSPFDGEALSTEVEACHGCGKCRSYCPLAMATNDESFLGRAKANLLRELISGRLDPDVFLASPELKKVMDGCVNCKRCLTECPSGVDIPWVSLMARAHHVKNKGQAFKDRFIADTHLACRVGNSLAPLVNLAFSIGPARALIESAIGLDRRRKMPAFSSKTFREMYRGSDKGNGKVAYFLSCYANYNDPEGEGRALVEVMERNGFGVEVPEFECCGIARISSGGLEPALKGVGENLEKISALVGKGIPVVFSEPSCALAVKQEYPRIVNSEKAARAAAGCYEVHGFLSQLKQEGRLNTHFGEMKLRVGYHNPCHLRALGISKEVIELLRLIPGLEVRAFSDQCCGLAGTFGMKRQNYDLSMEIGKPLFEEIKKSGVERVVTGCGSCAMQIAQGTGLPVVHPLALLAEAYRKG